MQSECAVNDTLTDFLNKQIESRDVKQAQDLRAAACNHDNRHACKWFRAILPRELVGKPTGWVDEAPCNTIEVGDDNFNKLLNDRGETRSDGGGGLDKDPRTQIAGSGMVTCNRTTGAISMLFSRLPGRQPVPRSET